MNNPKLYVCLECEERYWLYADVIDRCPCNGELIEDVVGMENKHE